MEILLLLSGVCGGVASSLPASCFFESSDWSLIVEFSSSFVEFRASESSTDFF